MADSPLPPIKIASETQTWKHWEPDHPELHRTRFSTVVLNDKLLIIGGFKYDEEDESPPKMLNLVLIDPEKQTVKTIQSFGNDVEQCCWGSASACYWKDSKIVVFGGSNDVEEIYSTALAIITLKNLDSENPSAYWEKVKTEEEIYRREHSAYIYQDKMYVFGGFVKDAELPQDDILCLDLENFAWSTCKFTGDEQSKRRNSQKLSVFSNNNKAYLFEGGETWFISEYDLSTMTCRTMSTEGFHGISFSICRQIIDEKIYFLIGFEYDPKRLPSQYIMGEVLVYDLRLEKMMKTLPVQNFPVMGGSPELFLCNENLMSFGRLSYEYEFMLDDLWSLKLEIPKETKSPDQPSHLTKLQQTMKKFLTEAPYSDISFEVEDQTIPAHKWWLAKRSKYFMNMFSSGMVEAQASKITITDMKASTFKAFLEYLYSDDVQLNETLALELLQQADKYSVPDLKKSCETYLAGVLSAENYLAISQMAELVEADSLRQAVIAFVAKNIKNLKLRKDFDQLSMNILRESIVKFIVK